MATLILIRHGRSTANTSGVLAGRSVGVHLDDRGREQAAGLVERLAQVEISHAVSSPLERCQQTAEPLIASRRLELITEDGLAECDYGEWTGRPIKALVAAPLWKTVPRNPSAVRFPGGESLQQMSARAIDAVRRHDSWVEQQHGAQAAWVAFSHGDLIKSVIADALGMHLDLFQRVHVDPGSISVLRYGTSRPSVLAVNTHAGDLGWVTPPKQAEVPADDAVVGGGSGPAGR